MVINLCELIYSIKLAVEGHTLWSDKNMTDVCYKCQKVSCRQASLCTLNYSGVPEGKKKNMQVHGDS